MDMPRYPDAHGEEVRVPRRLARLAGEEPRSRLRDLAGVRQGTPRQAALHVRGGGRGSALLRLDRHDRAEDRRRSLPPALHAADEPEELVEDQPRPLRADGSRRPDDGRRPRETPAAGEPATQTAADARG